MMHSSVLRPLARVVLFLLVVVTTLGASSSAALAQTNVVGTADFRNAPALVPGQYTDRIVTGDTAWYALIYTNETPYRFEVSIPGVDLDSSDELDLTATFVAPTLTEVSDPDLVVSGSGLTYPSGATNIWFLKVTLDTTDVAGVEYQVLITVEGVESTSLEGCATLTNCTFGDEMADLRSQLAAVEDELAAAESTEQLEDVELEISNLKTFAESSNLRLPAAEARLSRAEAEMATLCAPEITCTTFPDPGTKTPLIGWILGFGALGFGGYRAFKKLTASPEPDPTE